MIIPDSSTSGNLKEYCQDRFVNGKANRVTELEDVWCIDWRS